MFSSGGVCACVRARVLCGRQWDKNVLYSVIGPVLIVTTAVTAGMLPCCDTQSMCVRVYVCVCVCESSQISVNLPDFLPMLFLLSGVVRVSLCSGLQCCSYRTTGAALYNIVEILLPATFGIIRADSKWLGFELRVYITTCMFIRRYSFFISSSLSSDTGHVVPAKWLRLQITPTALWVLPTMPE